MTRIRRLLSRLRRRLDWRRRISLLAGFLQWQSTRFTTVIR